ncbi:RsfA family transcriptional regulator [Rossellomorea sp. BNER]|uniref:RsfA family transcriptional regulator n=1 Tax=Rossellomorea sp. BNER TaxID=2962031 RepID=UPI003AF2E2C3|nr:RsfA family transcriptional regulator [Rossellomorea sp. BNER]
MTSNRQDAWSQDEDLLLAEVVLRHIREGGTQLQAFEEVGKKLSRTSAACGFRWNSFVRKQYKSGIDLAKKQRKENKKKHPQGSVVVGHEIEEDTPETLNSYNSITNSLSLEQVIHYLKNVNETIQDGDSIIEDKKKLEVQIEELKKEVNHLRAENENYEKKLQLLEEDHHSLLTIFEKARKMALLQGSEDKVKFQMDKNGNLQRVQK